MECCDKSWNIDGLFEWTMPPDSQKLTRNYWKSINLKRYLPVFFVINKHVDVFYICAVIFEWFKIDIHSSWWYHDMESFSALLALCKANPPVIGGLLHKGQWRGALMFSLIYARTKSWANNRDVGDLRHQRVRYDATIMPLCIVVVTSNMLSYMSAAHDFSTYFESSIPMGNFCWFAPEIEIYQPHVALH